GVPSGLRNATAGVPYSSENHFLADGVGVGGDVPGGILEGASGAVLLLRPVLHLDRREGETDRFRGRIVTTGATRPRDVVDVDPGEVILQVDQGRLAAGLAQYPNGGVVEAAHAAGLEQAGAGIVGLLHDVEATDRHLAAAGAAAARADRGRVAGAEG